MFLDNDLSTLRSQTLARRAQAFRPGTTCNHIIQWRSYLGFCIFYDLKAIDPEPNTVCMFLEFLARTFKSPQSLINYLSGIRTMHKTLGIETLSLDSYEVKMMLRAFNITFRHIPFHRPPISIELLRDIVYICKNLGTTGTMLKCAFIFLFMGFLRQSNVAPSHQEKFDINRHTARGDVLYHPPGLILILKWTKTIQGGESALIPLPYIHKNILCPVTAFQEMCEKIPGTSMDPLLILPGQGSGNTQVTTKVLQLAFSDILAQLNVTIPYTLHSFRSGGASSCFHGGADPSDVKNHGTWKSNTFWKYIQPHPATSSVPKTLYNMSKHIT